MLLFGMGPNVYPVEKKQQRSLEFDTEIVVFSTTAVYVKGVVDTLKEGWSLQMYSLEGPARVPSCLWRELYRPDPVRLPQVGRDCL